MWSHAQEGNEGLFDCVLTGYHVAFAQDRNERLFYYVLTHNMEELLPVVGMPTVSSYCQTQALMFKPLPRSLWITLEDRGTAPSFAKNQFCHVEVLPTRGFANA